MDSAIFLDVDIIVMTDLHNLWKEFDNFTPKQMIGLAQESEISKRGNWYTNKRNVKFPFIAPYGMNAGILLMNFTRMRDFMFFKKIDLIYRRYKSLLTFHDQDLINILGYYNPGKSIFSISLNRITFLLA